jgi:hypothetical protein
MGETYIMIEDRSYQTNTDEQVLIARSALRQAAIEYTDEYAGLPDGQGDSYPNGNKVFALDPMEEIRRLQAEVSQLEQQNMQLQIQNQLLQQMIGAGAGESLGDEACGFIDGDDVPCTSPATQLLIDPSGVRCPVCDEHARTAPPDLKKVRPS